MFKNIIRLLAVFLLCAVAGIISQLYATEGVEKKVILHDPTVPAPPATTQTVPFDLGPMGCPGCQRIEIPVAAPPPAPPAEPTEEQKKQEIEKITKEKERKIKGHKEAIADYEKKLKEGTSTLTNEELKTYIAKRKEAIAQAEKEAQQKIAEVQAGKLPKAPEAPTPPAAPPAAPEVPKAPEKPTVTKPETKKPEVKKPEVKKETAQDKELREWLEKEKRNPLTPPDQDKELNQAVDAIADDVGFRVATQVVQGEVPMPSLAGEVLKGLGDPKVKTLTVAKDMVTFGPVGGAVVAAGKTALGKGVEFGIAIHKDYTSLQRQAIDTYYQQFKEEQQGLPGTERRLPSWNLVASYARAHGAPAGKEEAWVAAYFAARYQQEQNLKKDFNRLYTSYQQNMQRDFSAYAKPKKEEFMQKRQQLLNAAKMY